VSLEGRWVGFDLDLTLIDSRPGIEAVYRQLSAQTGVRVELSDLRIGPPLAGELRKWFPEDQIADLVQAYRALYPTYAVDVSPPLPGAHQALAAVRELGGRIAVITSKNAPNAQLHLDHCGFDVDELIGSAFGDGKQAALARLDAVAYAGDFEADMHSAVAAGVAAVGVTTGPSSAADLFAAGAEVVLADLHGFGDWLRSFIGESHLGLRPSSR
jgi:phosphoglycolate phosphatase